MVTEFEVQCSKWKEWLSEYSDGLKYEYRVRSLGSDRYSVTCFVEYVT